MNKFDLKQFLAENKLTQLGRLTEQPSKNYNKIFKKYGFSEDPIGLVKWTETGVDVWRILEPNLEDPNSGERTYMQGGRSNYFMQMQKSQFGSEKKSDKISLQLISSSTPEVVALSKVLKSTPYVFDLDETGLLDLDKLLNRASFKLVNL